MGAELPPRAKGMTDDQYLQVLVDARNNNPLVKLFGRQMTLDRAKEIRDKAKTTNQKQNS